MPITTKTLAAMAEQAYEDDNRLWPAVEYPFLIRNATTDTVAWCCKSGGEIVIAFRGSDSVQDWLGTNADILMTECGLGMAHAGFVRAARSVMQDVLWYINATKPTQIHLTGHSLGGALAVVMAERLLGQNIAPERMDVVTFGCPRVGDETFRKSLSRVNIVQYVRRGDPVPNMPPEAAGYRHAVQAQLFTKQEVSIDNDTAGHSMTQYRKDFEETI